MHFYINVLEVDLINIPTSQAYKENALQNNLKNKLVMCSFVCLFVCFQGEVLCEKEIILTVKILGVCWLNF